MIPGFLKLFPSSFTFSSQFLAHFSSHFMHFYPFHHFFALFCLQNSRKYSKTLENTILVAQFYNTSIFTSKASHSHIGGNIIFVRVLEDKHLRSHNMNIPSAYLSVWLHLGGWIVFDALTTLFWNNEKQNSLPQRVACARALSSEFKLVSALAILGL